MRKEKVFKILFLILFAAVWVLLFLRCRFGFPSDEALYLLVPYRFINGDIPVLHEWHPTQISGMWIHPLVYLFLKINGGTAGIFLAFRYIYTAFWGIFALFIYYRLRKISDTGAMAASLTLLIYAPYGEMALYYNTIGIMTLMSALVILVTAERIKTVQYIAAGFLLAVSVTCCPYLLILYIVLGIIYAVRKELRSFALITAGAACAFVLFVIYYVSKSSLSKVLGSIKYLTEDREHQIGFGTKILTYFGSLLFPSFAAFFIMVIFAVTIMFIKYLKTEKAKMTGFIITVVLVAAMQIDFVFELNYINCFMFAPLLLGLYSYIFSNSEIIRKLFIFIWIPGLIYSFCLNLSSNLGISAVTSAASLMTAVSFVMAAVFIKDNTDTKKALAFSLAVLAVFQVGLQLHIRMNTVFDKTSISNMTETVENGAVKGIRTTQGRIRYYLIMLKDIEPLMEDNVDKVLILSPESWLYLDAEKDIGSYTCWSPFIDEYTVELLKEYYELYPDMMPDKVYVESYYTDLVPLMEELGYDRGEPTFLEGNVLTRRNAS